jgi:hypothetical protein
LRGKDKTLKEKRPEMLLIPCLIKAKNFLGRIASR